MKTATVTECVLHEGGLAFTSPILRRGRKCWVIHRGRWPEGRGSARTLVAGGLPLSDKGRSEFRKFAEIIFPWCFYCWGNNILPNNLTRHFSRPLLCLWVGVRTLSICGRGRATWWFLSILFFDWGGCTEGVEDNVLVFFPVASLWVQRSFDISLGKQNSVNPLEIGKRVVISNSQTHHKVLVARVWLWRGIWLAVGAGGTFWRWTAHLWWLWPLLQPLWPGLAGWENPWLERAPDILWEPAVETKEVL